MANALTVQVTEDGPRNVVAKVVAVADTADFSGSTVLDPATLDATFPPTDRLRIDEIQYSVQDGWYVILYWDATTAKRIVNLTGRGIFPLSPYYPGLHNDAGVGNTGKILLSTSGYSSGTMVATLILHCIKETSLDATTGEEQILTEAGDPLQTEAGIPLLTE